MTDAATTPEPVTAPAPVVDAPVMAPAAPTAATAPAAPVAPTTEPTKVATIVDAPAAPDAPVAGKYPEDWRETAAKGDEKKLERLKRYASPEAAMEALIEAQNKLRSGVLPKPVGAESTPEEIAEYRKVMGVPETAEGYSLDIGDGYVIGDDLKPAMDKFLAEMHASNAQPEVVQKAIKSFFDLQVAKDSDYLLEQENIKKETQTQLRQEWGHSYDKNLNVMSGYLKAQFGEDADVLLGAVDINGVPIMNQPNIVRKFLQVALDNDPISTVLGHSNAGGIATIEQEIKEIEALQRTNRREYFKDNDKQQRYQELLGARAAHNSKK